MDNSVRARWVLTTPTSTACKKIVSTPRSYFKMARINKNKNKNVSVARRDPMMVGPRRPRMKVNFDGQFLNGTTYTATVFTALNSASGVYFVDCANTARTGNTSNNQEQSIASSFNAMTALYNEFVYRSLVCEWVPLVSPGVADGGSQCYVSYIDNAEDIERFVGATTASVIGAAKFGRNTKFFNAWERFTYTVPLTNRRKTFDVNQNNSYIVDSTDRSVQGAVLFGANAISAAISLGSWRFRYIIELRGLNNNLST
jgi:hypothetical protein